jgi:hypothetical protein
MLQFSTLVTDRGERILSGALEAFPDAALFARGEPSLEPEEETSVDSSMQALIAEKLGLESRGSHSIAEIWAEREWELEWAFREASRRHAQLTTPGGRAPWLWRDTDESRSGFNYFRELPFDVHGARSKFRLGISTWLASEGLALMWLLVPAAEPSSDGISSRVGASTFESSVQRDSRGLWIPVDLKPFLRWDGLVDDIFNQVYEIRKVLEDTDTPGSAASNAAHGPDEN